MSVCLEVELATSVHLQKTMHMSYMCLFVLNVNSVKKKKCSIPGT